MPVLRRARRLGASVEPLAVHLEYEDASGRQRRHTVALQREKAKPGQAAAIVEELRLQYPQLYGHMSVPTDAVRGRRRGDGRGVRGRLRWWGTRGAA